MKRSFSLISRLGVVMCAAVVLGCTAEQVNVDGTGTIEAQEVDVAAQQSGILQQIEVTEGDVVQPEQLLARTDDEIQKLKLQQAEAQREQAEAQLEMLQEGPHPKDIERAEAQLAQAKEQLELAEKEWRRIETLYEENSVTRKQYDAGLAEYRSRQAQYDAVRASLEKLQNLARPQEIASAEAALRQTEQQVAIAERQVRDCSIRSPIRGTVSEIYYEVGEMVPAGRTVATVRTTEQVYLTVYVPEPLLAHIGIGQSAEVYVDGMPDSSFSGRISHISQEAEFTPKNVQTKEQRVKLVYALKLDVQNRDGILKPGMPADVDLQLKPEAEE